MSPGVFDGLITSVAWDLGDFGPAPYASKVRPSSRVPRCSGCATRLGFIDESSANSKRSRQRRDSGGVTFVPAFTGLGSPFWRSDARGSITGLSRGVGRGQIARALVEALAFQVRAMTDAFGDGGHRVARTSRRRRRRGDGSA